MDPLEIQFGDIIFLEPYKTPYKLPEVLVTVLNNPKSHVMSV